MSAPVADSAVSSPFVQSPKLGALKPNGAPAAAANGSANGAKENGQRKDFLSDRAASTEIDGSGCLYLSFRAATTGVE